MRKFSWQRFRFLILNIILMAAYILLPVWLTPGNTLSFQLSILRPRDYLLFVFLSPATSLLILTQLFLYSRPSQRRLDTPKHPHAPEPTLAILLPTSSTPLSKARGSVAIHCVVGSVEVGVGLSFSHSLTGRNNQERKLPETK